MNALSKQLTIYKAPALLTEREVRIAGQTSNRLCTLRGVLKQGLEGGSLTTKTSNGSASLALSYVDIMDLIWPPDRTGRTVPHQP